MTTVKRTIRTLTTAIAVLSLLLGLTGLALTAAPAAAAPADATATRADASTPGVSDSVARLYRATYNRDPDPSGKAYWVDLYVRGMPLTTIAEHFMVADEWKVRYGSVDDATFVALLYRNVLGREANSSGQAYWQGELGRGYPRAALLVSFSESQEHIDRTGTAQPVAPPPPPGPPVPAGTGTGMRIIYSNSGQRVWMVDAQDLVVDSYLVSGRAGVPRPGTYEVFSKSERAWAGHDGITMRWMVRFAHGSNLAIGFHSIPRYSDGRPLQSESQLGSYRSAGCVRQADHKAEALYRWAPVGTTVVVLR